jgi:hypothetical protein
MKKLSPHFSITVPCPSIFTLLSSTARLGINIKLYYQEIERSQSNQKTMDDTQLDPAVDAVEETEEVSEEAALTEEGEVADESSEEEVA